MVAAVESMAYAVQDVGMIEKVSDDLSPNQW